MPGYNRSGPMGNGPMTGKGMGFCNNMDLGVARQYPGAVGLGRGMGMRQGRRRGIGYGMGGAGGRGFARRCVSDFDSFGQQETAGEIETLKRQAESLKNTLDAINRRMEELEKAND